MTLVNDNSINYRKPIHVPERDEEKFQVFVARVLTVDWEREVVTLLDTRTNMTMKEVGVIPAHSNSIESTDVTMPEEGATYLCVPLYYHNGYTQVALIAPILSDTQRTKDAIGYRLTKETPVWNQRRRGNFRKAWPGQRSVSMSSGYTEKVDIGWDKSSQDFSRDKLDSIRRQWTQTTGRRVTYTDSGISFQGSIARPDADGITPVTLPDGTKDYTVYLQPGAVPKDRYVSGKQDVIPFAESTTRIQEYALDYPLPPEIFQTDLMDTVLGTTSDPWQRTSIQKTGSVSHDDKSFLVDQSYDHPISGTPVGPTLNEGSTPQRRGFILETTAGTLVGYNRFDKATYGKVLKPVLGPYTQQGRFGADFESSYLPVGDSTDHTEARLAAACYSVRFPHEYNTTRWDVTKEGMLSFEIGATLPKENIPLSGSYEHPHGAGRSVEGHLVGSLKLVVGKNRDEEDAVDAQFLGQTVLRFGADDTSLPNRGRTVLTQNRGKKDAPQDRTLNYWSSPKLTPGDAGDLTNKTGAENISLRFAADGGFVGRIGARDPNSKRRHLVNGYQDGQGKTPYPVASVNRIDSHSAGRPTYGAGDSNYVFNNRDWTRVGSPQAKNIMVPYNDWMGNPVPGGMDSHGLSLDLHLVRDALLRIGKNPASGQSVLLDLDGGMVLGLGKDSQGRSLTAQLDGGVEMTIGQSNSKRALRMEINGDVDLFINGNKNEHITGDYTLECANFRMVTMADNVQTAQKFIRMGLALITDEAPEIIHNQLAYSSSENA